MQFESNVTVTAFKASKGEMNGKLYDSTKVYIETTMSAGERSKGSISAEYTWGFASNYDLIEQLDPPFKAKAVFQQVSNGRDTKTILINLIPEKSPVKA